ncbi:MAG: hypothetical protein ACD_75C00434G0003 [uncultured bacterium]|nr:MAG: hypothetical protein ACD_75C00434G0003 [uncultured bacterium]
MHELPVDRYHLLGTLNKHKFDTHTHCAGSRLYTTLG